MGQKGTASEKQTNRNKEIREELLDIAERGRLKHSANHIKKASDKVLERIYNDYRRQQLCETNETIIDIVILKFTELMERLNMIENAKTTGKKLQEKKLFRKDLNELICKATPSVLYVGLIEGTLTLDAEVASHRISFANAL